MQNQKRNGTSKELQAQTGSPMRRRSRRSRRSIYNAFSGRNAIHFGTMAAPVLTATGFFEGVCEDADRRLCAVLR